MPDHRDKATTLAYLGAAAHRTALLALLWWALTEGTGGWSFGLPLAALAAAISLWLSPPARHTLRLHRIPLFAAYFLWQSLYAGWDVARRTLSRRLPLRPGIVRLPLRLPAGAPTWWLMTTISLLPGTLSVGLDGTVLELHCLDIDLDVIRSAQRAETQLAALFGYQIMDRQEPPQ